MRVTSGHMATGEAALSMKASGAAPGQIQSKPCAAWERKHPLVKDLLKSEGHYPANAASTVSPYSRTEA